MSYIYQKVYKYKRYPHFDNKVHWRTVKGNVETPEYIIHHAFFPFIHYEQKMTKFPKKFIEKKPEGSKRDDPKTRQIMYSSHIDRYIYEYYSLNFPISRRQCKSLKNKDDDKLQDGNKQYLTSLFVYYMAMIYCQ